MSNRSTRSRTNSSAKKQQKPAHFGSISSSPTHETRNQPSLRNSVNSIAVDRIVRSTHPRLEVVAVPGAGKTTMLAARVKYLVEEVGIRPEQILALSYANATVEDLKAKLKGLLGDYVAERIKLSTVHACARQIAADAGVRIELPSPATIGKPGKANKKRFRRMLTAAIPVAEKMHRPWNGYQHILVDEWQDCSPLQTRLIVVLARRIPNILVVGDPRQLVYAFNGSRYTKLSTELDDVKTVRMDFSHRLTHENAAFAATLFPETGRPTIRTATRGPKPVLFADTSLDAQIKRVASEVEALINSGVEPHTIGVVGRTKAVVYQFDAALLARGVRTARIAKAVGRKHLTAVAYLAHCVQHKSEKPIHWKQLRDKLEHLQHHRDKWETARDRLNKIKPGSLDGILQQCVTLYLWLLGDHEDKKLIQIEVNRWVPWSRQFPTARKLVRAARRLRAQDAVATSTMHAAKGREWKHVFVVGVVDGFVPFHKADDDDAIAEENRLLYVAATRSSELLRIYQCPMEHAPSKGQKFSKRSRFLARAINTRLIDFVRPRRGP